MRKRIYSNAYPNIHLRPLEAELYRVGGVPILLIVTTRTNFDARFRNLFSRRQFSDQPKLLVLGGMEELGEKEEELHQDLGAQIQLEENDLVVLVGEKASWLGEGILAAGGREDQVLALNQGNEANSIIEDFKGAIFFKGSRSLKLETLVPEWAVEK